MAIIRHGTEKQRRRHLRAGLRGEAIWAQGLAEPGVGRDLANVRTHAVSAGEEYLVSGTKISPGRAVDADWMYTLVRTSDSDSARNSLSYLLIDLSSPGVTLRQLDDTGSGQPTFEVSLDSVRVPVDCRVGAEHDGWRVVCTSMFRSDGHAAPTAVAS